MIQSGLFFVLGFACAVFLVLMVAPAIWRRAVYLTRRRVEGAVALTANEVQAEKDRLRAEHARSLRRLEIRYDTLRDEKAVMMANASRQVHEIQQAKDAIYKLENTVGDLKNTKVQLDAGIAEGEMSIAALKLQLETRDGEINSLSADLGASRGNEKQLQERFAAVMETLEARETENASLRDRMSKLHEKRREEQAQMREMRAEAGEVRELLSSERERSKLLEDRLERAVRDKTDQEERLSRRENDLERLRQDRAAQSVDMNEWAMRLADARQDRRELEEELAQMTLAYNKLQAEGPQGETGADAQALQAELEVLQIQLGSLKAELKTVVRDRDAALERLQAAAVKAETAAIQPLPASRNAASDDMLRDQMNQIAAEMVTITALLEGEDSPIHALIDSDDDGGEGDVASLADRIRQLRGRLADAAE